MKSNLTLAAILISWMSVYGQSNSDEIQRLQKLAKENEERAVRAEAIARVAEEDAKRKRYILAAIELADRSIEIRDKELFALLALQAYNFNTLYGGYSSTSKIYGAVFNSLKKYDRLPHYVKGTSQAMDSLVRSPKNTPTFSAFLPKSRYVVRAEKNGDLTFVSDNGAIIKILVGHNAQVDQITFSHSGQLMATSGEDNIIRIWNLNQINHRPIIIEENSRINNLTFSPDDSQVLYRLAESTGNAKVAENFKVKILPLDMKYIASRLCEVLTRNLTKEEWDFYVGADLDYEQTCSKYPPNNK